MDRDDFDQWDEDRRKRRAARERRRREAWRERFSGGPRPRKEKVMHTRISDDLDETLRRAADDLRVPVSNLVRNVLEDVFDVVETVTDNVGGLVDDLIDEADRVRQRFGARSRTGTPPRPDPKRDAEDAAMRESARREVDELDDLPRFEGVVGWQPLVLNAGQRCGGCGRDMERGDRAFMGITDTGAPRAWICDECIRAVEREQPPGRS